MLKTSKSTESKTQPSEGRVGVSDSKGGQDGDGYDGSRIRDGKIDGGEVRDDEVGKKVQKLSKFKNLSKSDFFTLKAMLAFTELRQMFVKALILHHFNSKRHIRIETDASSYTIGGVFSQPISDDLRQWHPVTFFS